MISFKDYLTESKSSPVYHGTWGNAMWMIFIQGQGIRPLTGHSPAKLAHRFQEPSDFGGRVSGVSVSRNFKFSAGYGSGWVIELDQVKIAQRYKIRPFNYWMNRSAAVARATHETSKAYNKLNEYEEFIITNKNIPVDLVTRVWYPKSWENHSYILKHPDSLELQVRQAITQKYGATFIRTY